MVHLNIDDKTPKEVPYFYFVNLVEENPYHLWRNYPIKTNDEDSLVDSLNKERDHTLVLIHNQTFFQKGSFWEIEHGRQWLSFPEDTTINLGNYHNTNHLLLVVYLGKSEKWSHEVDSGLRIP